MPGVYGRIRRGRPEGDLARGDANRVPALDLLHPDPGVLEAAPSGVGEGGAIRRPERDAEGELVEIGEVVPAKEPGGAERAVGLGLVTIPNVPLQTLEAIGGPHRAVEEISAVRAPEPGNVPGPAHFFEVSVRGRDHEQPLGVDDRQIGLFDLGERLTLRGPPRHHGHPAAGLVGDESHRSGITQQLSLDLTLAVCQGEGLTHITPVPEQHGLGDVGPEPELPGRRDRLPARAVDGQILEASRDPGEHLGAVWCPVEVHGCALIDHPDFPIRPGDGKKEVSHVLAPGQRQMLAVRAPRDVHREERRRPFDHVAAVAVGHQQVGLLI